VNEKMPRSSALPCDVPVGAMKGKGAVKTGRSGPRRRGPLLATAAVLAAFLTTVVAAGCGSSGQLPAIAAPSATAKTVKVRVVSNPDWQFRMAYPNGWVGTRYQNPQPDGGNGTLQFLLAYADPHGAQSSGTYLDSVQTAVYQLDKPMRPADLTAQAASQLATGVILKGMKSYSARAFKKVDVAGVPGWALGYQFKVGSQVVDANSILIVKGRRAYWMTAQSGAYSWQKIASTLATCQRYFKLLPEQQGT